ncbi:hypothetical protein [Dyadobacter beijingensis]|nr:hypothetical protein [Dyadobacter beijingensis]
MILESLVLGDLAAYYELSEYSVHVTHASTEEKACSNSPPASQA